MPPDGFSGYVPARVRWLHVDAPGYRPLRVPIHWLNLPADSLRFRVVVPAVPVDKPMIDQPYFQSEQKPLQLIEQTPDRRSVSAIFRILDVLTGQPVRAEVCLFLTRDYQKTCYSASEMINCRLRQPDIIALDVRAPGYQLYLGNLVVNQAETEPILTYTIRLNPMPTLLMLSVPKEISSDDISLTPPGSNKPLMPFTTALGWTAVPGNYQLSVRLRNGVLQTDTIALKSGINGYAITDKTALHNGQSTPYDVVYLAQSYDLSAVTRSQLDLLVGHTDSVGNPQLNLILSEFRAKVTRTFV